MTVRRMSPPPLNALIDAIDRRLPIRLLSPDQVLRRVVIAAAAAIYGTPVAAASRHGTGPILVWTCGSSVPLRVRELPGWYLAFPAAGPLALDFAEGSTPAGWREVFGLRVRSGVIYPVLQVGGWRVALLVAGQGPSEAILPDQVTLALEALARRTADLLRLSRALAGRSKSTMRPARYESLRRRLARELHDGVGQPMSGLLIRVRSARERGFAAVDDLQAFEHAAHDAIEASRLIADGLRSKVPSFGHLASARRYAETILAAAGCALQWEDNLDTQRIEPRVARELAAVVKESVTNVVRHAHALEVTVRFTQRGGELCLQITDDGVGVEGGATRGGGLGLVGNAERADRLGGHFAITGGTSGGTVVTFTVPCRLPVALNGHGAASIPAVATMGTEMITVAASVAAS